MKKKHIKYPKMAIIILDDFPTQKGNTMAIFAWNMKINDDLN